MKHHLNFILKTKQVISIPFVIMILLFIPIFVSAQNTSQRIAVLNLLNQAQLKPQEIEYLTNLIRQSFAEKADQRFLLMTQENITLLLPPDKKMEDCLQECEVETGRVLGAKYIITGAILIFSETYRLNMKVHNTENGALVTSKVLKGKNLEELENLIQQASFELFEKIDEKQSDLKNLVVTTTSTNPQSIELKPLPTQVPTQAPSQNQNTKAPSVGGTDPDLEAQIKKSLGFGWFLGFGTGVEYVGTLGFQVGVQSQFSSFNFKLAVGINGDSASFSLKLFFRQPSKHQFGIGYSAFTEGTNRTPFETINYNETSLLYIYDIGQLKGFQLHAGLGLLTILDSTDSHNDLGISAGIHYLF